MSFYFGILIAVPNEEELDVNKSSLGISKQRVLRTVWRIEEVLNLSALKFNPKDPGFMRLTKRQRARAYFLDVLWPHLSKLLDEKNLEFAPKFLLFEDDFERYPHKFPGQMVQPWRGIPNKPIPTLETMQAHNLALESGLPKNMDELRNASGTPCPWLPCADLISASIAKSLMMVGDTAVLPYLRMWTTMLQQLDKVGGRAILLLHLAALTTFENTGDF